MNHPRIDFKIARLLVAAIVVTSVFSACAFSKHEPPPPSTADTIVDTIKKGQAAEAAQGKLTKENTKIYFEEQPEPNSYKLIVEWPASIPHATIKLNDGPVELKTNMARAEYDVEDGKVYNVQIIAYGQLSAAPLDTIILTAQSPKDFVFRERFDLTGDTSLSGNRLFFKPDGQIVTNGFSLVINVSKIYISESGEKPGDSFAASSHIRTGLGAIAKRESELLGSFISINSKIAIGKLKVAMLGAKNGGQGISGNDIEKTTTPPPSRVPAPATPDQQGTAGIQTKRERVCEGETRRQCFVPPPVCIQQPGNGAPGTKGAPGLQGGRGPKGGNSGTLRLNIEDGSQLLVEVRYKGGAGGRGGIGGAGFPGSLGGAPGIQPEACGAASTGQPGPKGEDGPGGESGDRGDGPRIEGATPVNSVEL